MENATCSIVEQGVRCGDPLHVKGMCQKHYARDYVTGSPYWRPEPSPSHGSDLPGEKWLPVPDWANLYEVSNMGRVRSLVRKTVSGWKGGRVLTPQLNSGGYLFVHLSRSGAKVQSRVHQLVLAAFRGPCPAGQEVLHGPRGKTCNELQNLRYGTRLENIFDTVLAGTHHNVRKERCSICGSDYVYKPYGGNRRFCPRQRQHAAIRAVRTSLAEVEGNG